LTLAERGLCFGGELKSKGADFFMAKSSTILVKMISSAETGYFYVAKKNPRKKPDKMGLKKYDPVVRKHVLFKESKIK